MKIVPAPGLPPRLTPGLPLEFAPGYPLGLTPLGRINPEPVQPTLHLIVPHRSRSRFAWRHRPAHSRPTSRASPPFHHLRQPLEERLAGPVPRPPTPRRSTDRPVAGHHRQPPRRRVLGNQLDHHVVRRPARPRKDQRHIPHFPRRRRVRLGPPVTHHRDPAFRPRAPRQDRAQRRLPQPRQRRRLLRVQHVVAID